MPNNVEILIRANVQGTGQVNNLTASLRNLGTAASGAGGTLTPVNTGLGSMLTHLRGGLAGGLSAVGGALRNVQGPIPALSGLLSGLASQLGSISRMALGVVVAMGVFQAIQLPGKLVGDALNAVRSLELLETTVRNLTAVELMEASGVERLITVGQKRTDLTDKERAKLEDLKETLANLQRDRDQMAMQDGINAQKSARSERDRQQALRDTALAMKEQELRIQQLTAKWGANGIDTLQAIEQLNKLRAKYADLQSPIDTATLATSKNSEAYQKNAARMAEVQAEIDKLEAKEGKLVDTMKKVREGQMSMSEAIEQAGPKTQELLKWIKQVAILSPFTRETVANTFQMGLAYGMTTEKAQRYTQTLVDFAAGTGRTEYQTRLLAMAMGQVQSKGRLYAEEMNQQLTEAGMGISFVAKALDMTTDELTAAMKEGKISADMFFSAIEARVDKLYKGAAARLATSWAGLTSTIADLYEYGLVAVFGGTFKVVQPYLAKLVEGWDTAESKLQKFGDALGGKVAAGIAKIAALWGMFQTGGAGGLMAALGFSPELQSIIGKTGDSIKVVSDLVAQYWGPTMEWLGKTIMPLVDQAVRFVDEHFEEFKWGLIGFFAVLAGDAGISILAGVAGALISLVGPVLVVAAGVGLLAAAWAGNWGDIQGKTMAVLDWLVPKLVVLYGWLEKYLPAGIAFTIAAFQEMWRIWVTTQRYADNVKAVLTAFLVPFIKETLPSAIEALKGFGQIFWGVFEVLYAVIIGFTNFMIKMFEQDWVGALDVARFNTQVFADGVKNIFEGLWNWTMWSIDLVIRAIVGLGRGIVAAFQELWDVLVGHSIIPELCTEIVRLFGELPDKLTDIGRDMVQGLINGLAGLYDALFGKLWGDINRAIDDLKSWLGISSPSTVMAAIGQDLVSGLVMGLASMPTAVGDSLSEVFDRFRDWGGLTLDEMEKFAQAMGNVPVWVVQTFVREFGRLPKNLEEWQWFLGPDKMNMRDQWGGLWFPDDPGKLPHPGFTPGAEQYGRLLADLAEVGGQYSGTISPVVSVFESLMKRLAGAVKEIDGGAADRAGKAIAGLTKSLTTLFGGTDKMPGQQFFDRLGAFGKQFEEFATKAGVVSQIKDLLGGFTALGLAVPDDIATMILDMAKNLGGPFYDAIQKLLKPPAETPAQKALAGLKAMLDEFQLGQQLAAAAAGMLAAKLPIPQALLDLLKDVPRTKGGYLDKVIEALLASAIPGLAAGIRGFGGGLALVGERGPELVMLPAGANVYSNRESRQMMGGNTYILNVSSRDDSMGIVSDYRFMEAISRGW